MYLFVRHIIACVEREDGNTVYNLNKSFRQRGVERLGRGCEKMDQTE